MSEIDDWRNEEPEGWHYHLNNFRFNMPGGRYRDLAKKVGSWSITYKEWMRKKFPDEYERDVLRHSEIYLNQTAEEFFETVDFVLDKNNISVDKVISLLNNKTDQRELHDLLAPVYTDLREMGYTENELTG